MPMLQNLIIDIKHGIYDTSVSHAVLGLWFSLFVINLKVLFHVTFRWPIDNDGNTRGHNRSAVMRTFRASWIVGLSGFLIFSVGILAKLNDPPLMLAWARFVFISTGLLIMNAGALLIQTAFCTAAGAKFKVLWAVAPIPVVFVIVALWMR